MSALWPPRAGQRSTSGCQLCVGLRSLVRLTPGDSTRPKGDIIVADSVLANPNNAALANDLTQHYELELKIMSSMRALGSELADC